MPTILFINHNNDVEIYEFHIIHEYFIAIYCNIRVSYLIIIIVFNIFLLYCLSFLTI